MLFKILYSQSRLTLSFAVLLGILSGASSAFLLGLISHILIEMKWGTRDVYIFVGLCVLRLLSGVGSHFLMARLSQSAVVTMRINLCRQILGAPLRHLEKFGTSRLMTVFVSDINSIASVVSNLPYFVINIIIIVGCLACIASLSFYLLLGALACLCFGAFTYLLPVLRAREHLTLARDAEDEIVTHFRSLNNGIKELKMHQRRSQDFLAELLNGAARRWKRHTNIGVVIYSMASNWNRTLYFVYVGMFLFVFTMFVPVDVGIITAYMVIFLYMMPPLEAIQNSIPRIHRANVAIGRVRNMGLSLMSAQAEQKLAPCDIDSKDWSVLTLNDVSVRYEGERDDRGFVVGPTNITITRGEIVFLVGGNGSGKTTLAKTVAGLYVPDEGCIRIDGRIVGDDNRQWYREYFSVIFSDFHVFAEFLGIDWGAVDRDAQTHIDRLQLQRKVSIEDGRISNINLSHGQRKRLALLTVLLEERSLLIFDEWAADQDPIYKAVFYHEILPELRAAGKTCLVISHDDRYFECADRILTMDEGVIVDESMAFPVQ
ncbi:MAG: cyclic peptide export ABC transporter [Planctomycetota bacterium]